jgi:hypothetical protein
MNDEQIQQHLMDEDSEQSPAMAAISDLFGRTNGSVAQARAAIDECYNLEASAEASRTEAIRFVMQDGGLTKDEATMFVHELLPRPADIDVSTIDQPPGSNPTKQSPFRLPRRARELFSKHRKGTERTPRQETITALTKAEESIKRLKAQHQIAIKATQSVIILWPSCHIVSRMLQKRLAQKTAQLCLVCPSGTLSVQNCTDLRRFWSGILEEQPNNKTPLRDIPGIELIARQALCIIEALVVVPGPDCPRAPLAQFLEDIRDEKLSSNGKKILMMAASDMPPSVKDKFLRDCEADPRLALRYIVLETLFSVHTQLSIPTCSIDASIRYASSSDPVNLAWIFLMCLIKEPGEKISLRKESKEAPDIEILPVVMTTASREPGEVQAYHVTVSLKALTKHTDQERLRECLQCQDLRSEGVVPISEAAATGPRVITHLRIPIHNLNDYLLALVMDRVYAEHELCEAYKKVLELFTGDRGDAEGGFVDDAIVGSDVAQTIKETDENGQESQREVNGMWFNLKAMKDFAEQAAFLSPGRRIKKRGLRSCAMGFTQHNTTGLDGSHGHIETFYLANIISIPRMRVGSVRMIGSLS